MSDINTTATIRLDAEDRATEVIRSLKRDVDALSRSLRNLTQLKMPAFASGSPLGSPSQAADALRINAQLLAATKVQAANERQAARQRTADARTEDRQRRIMEATALRDLRAREAANARAARQQLAGLRAVEREERRAAEAERRGSAARSQHARDTRYLAGLRQRHDRDDRRERDRGERDMRRHGRETWSRGRDAYNDITRPIGMTALAGSAASGVAARRILGAEADVDAAEINARSYGGLSEKAARALRTDWASPIAESLGAETSKLLTAWVDATKLGIPASGAKAFAELATKTSSAWEVPFENVTDIFGTINTLLTSKGEEFSADRLKSVANALQHLAAKQSTTPEKLISFLQRGAGAAQVLGMSQEAGLAFGSASTSLGNQAGQSGRMFDYLASRIIEMPRLTRRDGEEGDQARALVKALGYNSAEAMDRQRLADPDSFMPDFMSRFSNIKQQKKQDEAIRFFTGREWLGEFGRMVKGADTYKEAVRLSKESKGLDAIGAVWDLHRLKLRFVFKQFKAGWLNILGEFGKVLSPMAREAGDYFLSWTSKLRAGGLQARFKASIDGLLEGLGFKNLPDLLQRVFGKPGEGAAGAIETWRATFREFGAGIRDVLDSFRSIVNVFTGGSPEAIARWTGRIITLSAALLVLSPVLTVLGGITTGILALGSAAATVFTAMKVAGLVGASGAAAGAAAGAGGLAALLGAAVLPVSLVAISAGVVAALWGREAVKGLFLGVPSGNGGKPKMLEGDLGAELGAIAPRRRKDGEARIEKQSLNGDFDRRLIQPASFVTHALMSGFSRLERAISAQNGRNALSAITAPNSGNLGSFSGSGSSGGGVPGFPGGSPAVPGWFNRGGMGGAGGPASSGSYTFGNGLYDAIIKAEGTAKKGNPYDEVLGYGQYGRPEKRLSTMTLAEVHAHGLKMRQAQAARGIPWNKTSSASGAFQIVGNTMKDAAKALGMDWNTTVFDEATQKKMAAWIAKKQGLGAWEGFKHHPGELAKARQAMQNGNLEGSQPGKATTGPTMPGAPSGAAANPGPLVGGVHPMDGKGRFTSDFGMRNHPKLGGWRMHNGIDLAAPGGTAVKSMKEGVVSIDRSGDVTVKHPDGTSTTYRHVTAGVQQGQNVVAGQQIATLRQHDPRSTGPHLHLEGRDAKGGLIDPKTLLQPKPKTDTAGASKDSSPAHKPFESSGWQPDSWHQQNGGPWLNKRTGEAASPEKAAELTAKMDAWEKRKEQMLRGRPTPFTSSGWKPQNSGAAPAPGEAAASADPGFSSSGWKPSSAADAIRKLPMLEPKPALGGGQGDRAGMGPEGGSTMRGSSTIHVTNHIQAGNQSPAEMASHIQRHVTEAWNYRAHDLEPELT